MAITEIIKDPFSLHVLSNYLNMIETAKKPIYVFECFMAYVIKLYMHHIK